jgi:malto-oligosyltrehalose trehalohydrolase
MPRDRGIVRTPSSAAIRHRMLTTHLTNVSHFSWGPESLDDGSVRFRLWAPAQRRILLALEEGHEIPLRPQGDGWHELITTRAHVGSRYRFKLMDGTLVPDPASRFQPDDVMGPSEVTECAYPWRSRDWRGRPWHSAVIYEVHVGAFTRAGTFAAILERLPHLVELGVTAIQLMPIADFPGRHNWGYDGVLPYAPDSSYGRPEELKALVDAAHSHGLMILLDVVYNHFGPEGNYLAQYAPQFFTDRHHTPWGAAINFDGADARPVRDFFIENALYWLDEFRFDGLRLDAVHHLVDESDTHILRELAVTVRACLPDRLIHLILENEENEASHLARDGTGTPTRYTAQWNDDLHHVLHTAASNESHGYYQDYHGDETKLQRALSEGFAFQGEIMPYRGSARGEPSARLPPTAFVAFLQNHDQIGNRAFGERLHMIAPAEAFRAITAIYLLLPQIPMLFMGEEWQAAQPFVYFCDFKGALAQAIREGRRKEFARFPAFRACPAERAFPEPDDPATFASAQLDWDAVGEARAAAALRRYRRILEVRHRELIPRLPLIGPRAARIERLADFAFRTVWRVGAAEELVLTANLSNETVRSRPTDLGRLLWTDVPWVNDGTLAPWTVIWSLRTQ